jgi:hypothetical protein
LGWIIGEFLQPKCKGREEESLQEHPAGNLNPPSKIIKNLVGPDKQG